MKEQFKVYRFQLEGKLGAQVLPASPVWTWIGRHVAWIRDRFHAMPDGRTPYELYTDVSYVQGGALHVRGDCLYEGGCQQDRAGPTALASERCRRRLEEGHLGRQDGFE